MLGRWGNSHFSGKDINSKQCHRLTNLSEEEMTLEWAGISFEQGLFQYIIRLAEVSGVSCLVPLLSCNAGYMVAENLHRFELQGTVEMVDILLRQPLKNEWEFFNWIKAMPAPEIVSHGLQPPAVVHVFGHLKNHHLMLRRMIFMRMRQFSSSGHDSLVSFFEMLSDKALSMYAHPFVHQFTSTRHTHNLCIKTGKTAGRPT